ncbi:MAG TPA: class I SAM-dependent methyltransferase [Acidobacteriota bacterium]|nr:class I SAM-dependent methyltransferase [Acidobacteriota bacterium]
MKLNLWERALVNNPVRALLQHHLEARLLLSKGGRLEGKRVLEIGCGRGVGVEVIFKRFGAGHVTALDLDPAMIEQAKQRLSHIPADKLTLSVGDATAIKAPDAEFDAVFDFGIVHHIPDWQGAIREVARVLKPGGLFLFEEIAKKALDRWVTRTFLDHPTENRFSLKAFLAEMERQGIRPQGEVTTVWFGDIFIGVGRRT